MKIDRFGFSPYLTIKQQKQLTTATGGILTIVYYLLISLITYYYTKDLILKENPTIIKYKEYTNNNLPEDNFILILIMCITLKNSNITTNILTNELKYYHLS